MPDEPTFIERFMLEGTRRITAEESASVGTRTVIRFGRAVHEAVKKNLTNFELHEEITGPHHLLYFFHRLLPSGWHCFVLFQGARKAGRFNIELGISQRKYYPYYRALCRPLRAVDGARERMDLVLFHEERWWNYRSQDELENILEESSTLVARGFTVMVDSVVPQLEREMELCSPIFNQWIEADRAGSGKPLGERFRLKYEEQAYALLSGIYDRPLPPESPTIEKHYRDPRWLSCHTYIMAAVMEAWEDRVDFLESQPPPPIITDDEMGMIYDRVPIPFNLERPGSPSADALTRFAYAKGLAAVHAYLLPRLEK